MVFKLTVLEALQKHSIQAVATVIEQKGCYGFDKYLRISNEESIKTNALKAIENFCYHSTVFFDDLERLKNLGTKNEDYSKLDWLDKCTNELKKFGWLDEFLPDFSDSNPSEIVVRNKDEDHPRRVNTTYIIIAALFHYHDLKLEDSNKHRVTWEWIMSVQTVVQTGFDLIDCQETAEILGISKSALEAWRTTGRYKLPFIKVGRNVRYRRSDVLQWLESRTRANGTTA